LVKQTSTADVEEASKNLKRLTTICTKLEKEADQAKKNKERSEVDRAKYDAASHQLEQEVERLN
jgi:hypothetical protein